MEDWLKNYYEQTDPLKRQQMLLENKNETMSEEDKLRMKLWEARYGKGKPRKDMFVGYLMNLKYIALTVRVLVALLIVMALLL